MLVPVIAARDRWLEPGGLLIPRSVTAWAALLHVLHPATVLRRPRPGGRGRAGGGPAAPPLDRVGTVDGIALHRFDL